MSRSHKKTPVVRDNCKSGTGKFFKRVAISRIRNIDPESEESELLVSSPSVFRKLNRDTYEIHDYSSRFTEQEARDYYNLITSNAWVSVYYWRKKIQSNFLQKYPTEDDYINNFWRKTFKQK